MRDPRLEKLAAVLVRYSVGVKKGDLVLISGGPECSPLATMIYSEVLRAGGNPWLRLVPEECRELFLKQAKKEQLLYQNPIEKFIRSEINVQIGIWADLNSRALTNVDPAAQQLESKGRKPLMDIFMKRASKPRQDPDRLRWVGTGYPTMGSAQDAEMSLAEYEEFVFGAGKLHLADPVAAWKKLGAAQRRLCDFLNKAKEVRFRAPGGTDLRVGVQGRHWVNCEGHENFPDGGCLPDRSRTQPRARFITPGPLFMAVARLATSGLKFRAGRVVDASASKNEDYLFKMIRSGQGRARAGRNRDRHEL